MVVAVALLGWASIQYFEPSESGVFMQVAQEYVHAQDEMMSAAAKPGQGGNRTRQELDIILQRVLTEPMSNDIRQGLSKKALEKIGIIDGYILELVETIEEYDATMTRMETELVGVTGYDTRQQTQDIFELAELQQKTYREVEVLTKVIHERTKTIFTTIIKDKGALTDNHVRSLNEQLNEAEAQFDKRTQLFNTLKETKMRLEVLVSTEV